MWKSGQAVHSTAVLLQGRSELHQVVEEGLAFVEGLDGDALVAAVEADVVAIEENSLNAVGWYSGDAQVLAVGGAHDHHRNGRDTGPDFFGRAVDCAEEVLAHRRSGSGRSITQDFDAY